MYQRQLEFKEAVVRALTVNYCQFTGRASRSEFWWFQLFSFVLGMVVGFIFSFSENFELVMQCIVGLALLLPSLGLMVRRLHDIGKSGWWWFLSFIPLVGVIVLIVWFCKNSDMAPNQYGPVPNLA